jgi:hypothetical protein
MVSAHEIDWFRYNYLKNIVRFQVLTAASMMFRIVFWDVLPCKMIVYRRFRGAYYLMMEAVHTSETSVSRKLTELPGE